jgi:hypothetical protein
MLKRALCVAFWAIVVGGCGSDSATGPTDSGTEASALELSGRSVVSSASGKYQFLVPADFNGGIFGGEVDNYFDFHAKRHANGRVSGEYRYVQYDGSVDKTYRISGRVTCFQIYDTPVLQRTPEIPAMTANRAKWGGRIDRSNDPDFPVGMFVWAQSIDNGRRDNDDDESEGGDDDESDDESESDDDDGQRYPDVSTIVGLGDHAANEAFCASPNVPNPNFGPHRIDKGDIDVRPSNRG